MWQPGNLVPRMVLKNQALAERLWILFPHFLTFKQFGGNGISIFTIWPYSLSIFFQKINKNKIGAITRHFDFQEICDFVDIKQTYNPFTDKQQIFSCLTFLFSQKVFGPILRLPETLFAPLMGAIQKKRGGGISTKNQKVNKSKCRLF